MCLVIGALLLFFMPITIFRVFFADTVSSTNNNKSFNKKTENPKNYKKDDFIATNWVGGLADRYIEVNDKTKKWRLHVNRINYVEVPIYDYSDLRDFTLANGELFYFCSKNPKHTKAVAIMVTAFNF